MGEVVSVLHSQEHGRGFGRGVRLRPSQKTVAVAIDRRKVLARYVREGEEYEDQREGEKETVE